MQSSSEPPFVALGKVFEAAFADAARSLERQKILPVERDLKRELRASLNQRLAGLTLESTEHKLSLKGWPKVGTVDLAIDVPSALPVLIELKWGAGTLYNCAWDAVKLALALGEGATNAAYMVAGAPVSEWSSGVPGSELFADEDWNTTAFMERHALGFAKWRREVATRPQRLPDEFRSDLDQMCSLQIGGAPWELRSVAISLMSGSGWVDIDDEGHTYRAMPMQFTIA